MNIPPVNRMMPLKTEATQKPQEKEAAEKKKLQESARQLEGLFITFVLKAMEKTIPKEDKKNDLSTMMFSTVMGEEMAKQGGFGLADFLYRRLSQEDLAAIDQLKSKVTGDVGIGAKLNNDAE